jgi:hypothetical protein
MEREIEFLRQKVEYLERLLESCMAHITTLETRVAELERRPVALLPAEASTSRTSRSSYSYREEVLELFERAAATSERDPAELVGPALWEWQRSRRQR